MTGDQLAAEIKSIRSDIPIIICTGFSERIDDGVADGHGIDGLLMKPIVRSDLAKTVRKVLDGRQKNIQSFIPTQSERFFDRRYM